MPDVNGPDVLILPLSKDRELVIKELYLKRYKRFRNGAHGAYDDQDATNDYEIWVEKKDSAHERVITQIHEIMHFVGDVAEELEDPDDFDTLARYIYSICIQQYVGRGESK